MELPEQDRQALIDAARKRTQQGGAAFKYPSSGKRPEKLNVSRDVNMPAQMARGWAAGTLGLPGDIEALGRMGINFAFGPGGVNVDETPVLPTSEFYQEYLPGGDERPAAKFASGLGALTGGMGATKVAGAGVRGAKAAGKALGPKAAEMAEGYLQKSGLAPSVIKPKGGNWLSGTVEGATKSLKLNRPTTRDEALALGGRWAQDADLPEVVQMMNEEGAVNNWIDTKLNKYIKNEMATPEDPVRALAERGVLHVDPEQVGINRYRAPHYRVKEGYPREGLGKSEAARAWEDSSDMAIAPWTSGEISKTWPLETVEQNPWLAKVDPGSKVYEPRRAAVEGLGFDHLIDELRNATRADSDLPANLRWKPEDLKKVTVPQAVERVAKINEWRAAQKAEADAAKARNPATFTFKEYPEKGMQWVELATPSKLPEKFTVSENRGRFNVVDSATGNPLLLGRGQTLTSFKTPEEAVSAYYKQNPNVLEEALKYEGEVMGHCVGGYCPDVLEGRSRIYSLRDKKGEPHVTIEVQPNNADRNSAYIDFLRDDRRNQGGAFTEWLQKKVDADPSFQKMEALSVANMFRAENGLPPIEVITPPPKIVQIKGKGNKAPKEEYLPMVQDFVRSGNWSRVGDLHNTQLIAVDPGSELANALQTAGKKVPQYVTQDELTKLLAWNRGEGDVPQGYARGGLVKDTDVIAAKLKATGMDDQKAFMQALRMADARQEAHMAGGGLAKLLKGAAKAEDVAKVAKEAHPTILPPVAPLTKEQMRPIAQRVASQMTGEFVRPDPKLSINPAGKSKKVFQRERDLPVEVTEKIPQKSVEPFDIEKYEGYGLVGVPGDPTLGGVAKPGSLSQIHEGAAELKRLGDVEFEHPVQLFGGPRYGAYSPNDEFWASNIGPARAIQNRVTALSQAIDAPVLGEYIKMAPESTNFALHNLDALLSYMQPEKLGKKKLQELNAEIRKGSPKYGKFPGFSGFEDPVDVLLQSQIHSDLRKHIAETLMKPTVAEKFGMRPGSDVLFGISKPELRELEPGISGYSIGQMKPRAELTPSLHPTYDFDIPGTFLGSSKYPTPYEVAFPASTAYTRSQLKPGVQEFNMLKMVGPRERIDPQYIDQIKMYEELMKEYTGKKKGGLVKKSGLSVLNKAII